MLGGRKVRSNKGKKRGPKGTGRTRSGRKFRGGYNHCDGRRRQSGGGSCGGNRDERRQSGAGAHEKKNHH